MAIDHARMPITVLLDGVQGHYEIGMVFRVCEAFRVQRLVICGAKFNVHSRKLMNAAKGAHQCVPWTAIDNAFEVVKSAKDYGVYVIVAGQTASSISIRDAKPDFPALLVLGGQPSGANQRLQDWADTVVSISDTVTPVGVVATAAIALQWLPESGRSR